MPAKAAVSKFVIRNSLVSSFDQFPFSGVRLVPGTAKIDLPMSTLTATSVTASRRSSGIRILLWLLLILILIAGAAVAYTYFIARAALPQLDGSLRVKGLSAAVRVTRDSHGVPAIEA